MSYAEGIADKVINVLKKQVIEKGYEVTARLSRAELEESRISDTVHANEVFEASVPIIITKHDVSLFSTAIGDNPENLLDFIWIARDNDDNSPDEGMYLDYDGNSYVVTAVSPTYLGGRLIMKECRGRKTS